MQISERFVGALAARDFSAMESLFADGIRFRALIPPGLREAQGVADCTALWRRWFGDCDTIEIISATPVAAGAREGVTYKLRVHEEGNWLTVAQSIVCTANEGRIGEMDMLCSGFQPEA